MGSISDFLEAEFLDHILKADAGFTPAATLYVGLSVGDPLDTAAGIDETAGVADTYVRQTIAWDAVVADSREIRQNGAITFPEAGASWGTVTHWFICDHVSNATFGTNVNLYAHGSLNTGKAIVAGNTPSIADDEIAITVTGGSMSNYLADLFVDWAFDGGTLAQPTNLYVALASAALTDSSTGTSLVDLTMTDYARELNNDWDAAAGPSPMLSDNTNDILFGVLTGSGQTVEAVAVCDASADGNLLFYDNTVSQAIGVGDSVTFPAGEFDISIA